MRSPELFASFIVEIKLNLKQVPDVKKITIRKNDQLMYSNTYILIFNTHKTPSKLNIDCIIG